MLIFNVRRVINMRGIERAYTYLFNSGFTHTTSSCLATGRVASVKIKHIGKLCQMLHCTPNDLFEWETNAKNPLPEDHPLNALVKEEIPMNVRKLLKDIPLEKMSEVENLLKGLKDG